MSAIKHIGLFLVPVAISVLGVAWYWGLLTPVASSVPLSKAVQPFEVLDYPESTSQVQLPREWPSAELARHIGAGLPAPKSANNNKQSESVAIATAPHNQDDLGLSLDDLDLSSLSPNLARKVENALSRTPEPGAAALAVNDLERNARQWQGRLPALNLQTHMYASDASRRWVKINNVEYHQGDVVDGQVMLKEIQPQAVIVEFQGEQIRIPALYEWEG